MNRRRQLEEGQGLRRQGRSRVTRGRGGWIATALVLFGVFWLYGQGLNSTPHHPAPRPSSTAHVLTHHTVEKAR